MSGVQNSMPTMQAVGESMMIYNFEPKIRESAVVFDKVKSAIDNMKKKQSLANFGVLERIPMGRVPEKICAKISLCGEITFLVQWIPNSHDEDDLYYTTKKNLVKGSVMIDLFPNVVVSFYKGNGGRDNASVDNESSDDAKDDGHPQSDPEDQISE